MLTKKKIGIIAICLVLLSSIMLGCIERETQESTTQVEQVLTQGSYRDFKAASEGKNLVLEPLVGVDEWGNPIPGLAESWDVSPDEKTYTFYLRKGVKFHDGTQFNAEAARFFIEWQGKKKAYGKYMDRIEIVDDYTVRVYLEKYYYGFLGELGQLISPNAVEPAGDVNGKLVNYIGTGPFKLVDYKKDQEAVLVRNDEYWGKKPKLEKVIWKVVPDPYTQVLALKAGELDLIGAAEHHSCLPYIEIAKLQEDPNFEVMLHSYGRYQVIDFNFKREPFNDVRVRKAFNYAIDRELMVHTLFADLTNPAYLLGPPAPDWGPRNIEGYRYDPEKANQLLAEAGWKDTDGDGILDKDGKPFTCELIVPSGEANADVVSVFVQSELKKIGAQMKVTTMESGAAWDMRKKGEYDLFVHHCCGAATMACLGIGGKYHSGYTWGKGVYYSDELDKLIEKAFTSLEKTERRKAFDQIWEILHEEAPSIPLYDITKPVIFRNNVRGFWFGPTIFDMDLSDVEIVRYEAEAPTPTERVLTQGAYKDFKQAVEGRTLVFESLTGVDEQGNSVPKLAESWEISTDGKTYTFHLRQRVKFHDGTPFNASVAKFSIEWSAKKKAFGKYIDRMEVVDDHTLRVYLKEYYRPFLLDLATEFSCKVISPNAVEPAWDLNGKLVEYIGTGPFKLVDYKKDQEAVLVRNDDYWEKKPKLEKVIWKTVPDPYTQVLALKAGELDLIGAAEHHSCLPYIEIAELQKDPNLVVMLHSYGRYQVIRFNCEKEPFDDVRVRKAFNYALDKELMVHTLFADIPKLAYRITDPKFKWGPSNIDEKYYQYDPDKAKQLLAEAGWADTDGDGVLDKDGKPFTCELIVPAGEANADVVAPFMQSELKKLGIQMNILTLESGAAGKRQKEGEYDLYVHHSGCLPSIAGYIEIGGRYHAGGWPHGYQNDTLDKLIEKAWTTPDEAEWRALCDQIWEVLHEDAPCIPLYDITKPVVFRNNVHGFKFGPTMFEMDLSDVEMSKYDEGVVSTPIAKEEQVLTVATSSVGKGDLSNGFDAASYDAPQYLYPMIYDSLVEFGEDGEIKPALAERWKVSQDGKVCTFYLRKGVKFHDDTPFNATAVKFSLERAYKHKKLKWPASICEFTKIEIVDPYTIKIYFDKSYYSIVQDLSITRPMRIQSPSSVEPYGDSRGEFVRSIGTGPWKFDEWVKEQKCVLVRNEDYWGKKPFLQKIIFKYAPDANTRVMALKAGDVQLIGDAGGEILPTSVSSLKKDPNIKIVTVPNDQIIHLVFHYVKDPWSDVRVRKAVNHAIDRESIVEKLLEGYGKPGIGAFPEECPYLKEIYQKGLIKGYPYDPEKAKQLLTEAGWKDIDGDGVVDKDGYPLNALLLISGVAEPGHGLPSKPVAEVIQAQLKDVGIKVDIKVLESAAFYDAIKDISGGTHDLYIRIGVSGGPSNPHSSLANKFHSGEEPALRYYADPELDQLVDKVLYETDETARKQLYEDIFKILDEKAVVVPLYQVDRIIAFRKNIEGVEFNPLGTCAYSFEEVKVV